MTVKELIQNKDYDRIEVRMTHLNFPDKTVFYGVCKSKNGELISVDGDSYEAEKEEEILSYEEWSNESKNVKNGLTVVFKYGFWEREDTEHE